LSNKVLDIGEPRPEKQSIAFHIMSLRLRVATVGAIERAVSG
jgi:hypothetical protein